MLTIDGLDSFYGPFQALFDVSIRVDEGDVVAVIGANGAGKSTMLRTVAGSLPCQAERVLLAGQPIGGERPERVARLGVSLVPEGRHIFPSLTVEENLRIGGDIGRAGGWDLERVYDLFPALRERRNQLGTLLSGGQQQMLAIGRGLMANPRLLLLDEISLGLAPIVVRELYRVIPRLRDEGITVLLVEQDVTQATSVADRVYCLLEGRVSLEAAASDIDQQQLLAAYFGMRQQ